MPDSRALAFLATDGPTEDDQKKLAMGGGARADDADGVEALQAAIRGVGSQHNVQPRVISISQVTEFGTVYSPDEIRAISRLAKQHGLHFHMDGARFATVVQSPVDALGGDVPSMGDDNHPVGLKLGLGE